MVDDSSEPDPSSDEERPRAASQAPGCFTIFAKQHFQGGAIISIFQPVTLVFPDEIINYLGSAFQVRPTWKVRMLAGKDFDPSRMRFVGTIPKLTNFGVYKFQKPKASLK